MIQEELQNNPTLEDLPTDGVSLDQESEDGSAPAPSTDNADNREELDFSKEFEVLNKLNEDYRDYLAEAGGAQPYTSEAAERRQHFFDSLVSETSLQEHLMRQAELSDGSPQTLAAFRYLVGSLDDRGFLTASPADIALMSNDLTRLRYLVELGRRGRLRVIATGRNLFSARKVLPPDFPVDYVLFSSGAGIMDWPAQRLLRSVTMAAAEVARAEKSRRRVAEEEVRATYRHRRRTCRNRRR